MAFLCVDNDPCGEPHLRVFPAIPLLRKPNRLGTATKIDVGPNRAAECRVAWHLSITAGFCMPAVLDALVFTDDSNTPVLKLSVNLFHLVFSEAI
jgi:hypothetical protein